MRSSSAARAAGFVVATFLAVSILAACAAGDSGHGGSADADGGSGSSAPSTDADNGFPVTVDTKFGEVTIPEPPKRVVALGWADAETALALGVQPVGASDWLEFGGAGVGPWARGMYDRAPEIIGTLEPSYEDILSLQPDLILDVKSSGEQERYERLSEIAPTVGVPEGGDNYLTTQRQQVTMVAKALGKPEKGKRLLANVRKQFDEVVDAHPEFEGATVTVAAYTSNGWGAYIARTERVQFMKQLGFVPNPRLSDLEPEGFTVPISSDNFELLDADLVVVFPIGQPASAVTEQPGYNAIPAVREDRGVILDQQTIANAYSVNSVLSIPYALEHVTPLLADAMRNSPDSTDR